MRKAFFLVAILFSLIGCATTANYEKILASWVGSTELALIRVWGPPQQFYEVGGRRFLTYSNYREVYLPGLPPSYTTTYVGNKAYTNSVGGTPAQTIERSCQTTFEVYGEKIVSWSWEGNDCKAIE